MEARESRIHVLPDLLVKKIAAGEVVERPASVVKELLENAVDAGATRIAVTIEDGGRQLVRVTDDGFGMTPEELRLSVTPHATSKLRVEADLYAIATMGFRGEALASISSVSRLRIVSRPGDEVEGHELCVVAEQLEAAQAAGCPAGTTIEVRDLFFQRAGQAQVSPQQLDRGGAHQRAVRPCGPGQPADWVRASQQRASDAEPAGLWVAAGSGVEVLRS